MAIAFGKLVFPMISLTDDGVESTLFLVSILSSHAVDMVAYLGGVTLSSFDNEVCLGGVLI